MESRSLAEEPGTAGAGLDEGFGTDFCPVKVDLGVTGADCGVTWKSLSARPKAGNRPTARIIANGASRLNIKRRIQRHNAYDPNVVVTRCNSR